MNLRLVLLVAVFLLFSCSRNAGVAVFPQKAEIWKPRWSNLFQLAFYKGDTFLIAKDPYDSGKQLGSFVWGQHTTDEKRFRRIGSRMRIAALSAVFAGMLESLNAQNRVVGIDDHEYVSSGKILKRHQTGLIQDMAPRGQPNRELIVKTKTDLVLAFYENPKSRAELEQLAEKGIPVLFIQNYLESHPLGRAEWIVLFGALTGNFEKATGMFAEIEEHYLSTAARAESLATPTVLVNAPFQGVWDVPGGKSYMAQLISDAGGAYQFKNTGNTGRIPLSLESVFQKASGARIWLNPGVCRDYQCLETLDSRLKGFHAFQNQKVYNCTRLMKPNGANPWWDYGVLRPDLVLLDLFTIFHPEAEMTHEPVFFEPLK